MVTQFIAGIGMHEHVERSVIERKPTHDVRKLRWRKRDLVAPTRMGADLSLVKAAHLNPIAELRGHYFAKFPGRIATGRIEIDMRMPARDARHIEIRHCCPLGSRANPFRQSSFNSSSAPSIASSSGSRRGRSRPRLCKNTSLFRFRGSSDPSPIKKNRM